MTIANLKGFLRDWKYVTVLIGLPLVIVGMIFGSFGYGTISLPIGTVNNAEGFDYDEFEDRAADWAEITEYSNTEACLESLIEYEEYGCIEFENRSEDDRYQVSIYFDNTNNRVGNRIRSEVQKISSEFNLNFTEERADETLENITREKEKLGNIQSNITEFDRDLEEKVSFLNDKIGKLEKLERELETEGSNLRENRKESQEILNEIRQDSQNLSRDAAESLGTTAITLQKMENLGSENEQRRITALNTVEQTNQSLIDYQRQLQQQLEKFNEISEDRDSISEKEKEYEQRLENATTDLEESRDDLIATRKDLNAVNNTVQDSLNYFEDFEEFNASEVAKSVDFRDRGVYRTENTDISDVDVGEPEELNLLRLQTIFSTILVFISLFISILVSQFITVKHINSKTVKRLKMVEDISFPEYLSVFISSLIIISIPMSTVVLFGQYMFELPIFQNILVVALIVGLLCAAIVNLGISLAYFIKEKSITLLVGNLLLVFFSFFSGFILPLEFMKPLMGGFGSVQPATLAKETFDLTILYNQPTQDIYQRIFMMVAWIIILGFLAFKIKEYQDV